MTTTRPFDAPSRWLTILFVAALALAALPLGIAVGQENDLEIDGEVIEEGPDAGAGLIASTRYLGRQRFATAALIALETWDENDRAILARHDEWPDALAGGYLAGVLGAPVLLISQNNIQDDTRAALEGLGVSEVTILGGTQAISEANEQALEDLDYDVNRISGPTRFETAVEIAQQGTVGEHDGKRTAFVTTGFQFADALTAGPLAYDGNFPILLTPSQSLHPATERALQDLDIEQVILLGGGNAIAPEVETAIQEVIEGDEDSTIRLSGTTRIETAVEVAGFSIDELGFSPFQHGWARGNEFADALTIGPRLGEFGGPLLLVPTPTVVDSGEGTNAALAEAVACSSSSIDIAGGSAALSETVEHTLRSLLACPEEPLRVTLEADEESAQINEEIEVTATVTSNIGTPTEHVTVEFEAMGEPDPQPDPEEADTDADGQASAKVTSAVPGEFTVLARVIRDDHLMLADVVTVEFTTPAD